MSILANIRRRLVGPSRNELRRMASARALHRLRDKITGTIKGKYDAAQTGYANQKHWLNADRLDPHTANSLEVRQFLRSRSRYEVIENNPYLKGVMLTITNDFVGTGPKLQITDPRISPERRLLIKQLWQDWCDEVKLRQKLWRMRLAKAVDGEGFWFAYTSSRHDHPVTLDFDVVECDQVTSWEFLSKEAAVKRKVNEVDGVRFDNHNEPLEYGKLHVHPGNNGFTQFINNIWLGPNSGEWYPSQQVIHWFRQDRGWLRGIPEITPSLPLCALLRRYTLAVVRAAEIAAFFSAVLESEAPAGAGFDGSGELSDDPFDMFPLEMGMVTKLPWGQKLQQLKAEQPTVMYDAFVASLLREIVRPMLIPYNRAAGTSKDSNMASSVVDDEIYKGGQLSERLHCNESVLDKAFRMWWKEAVIVQELFDLPSESDMLSANPTMRNTPPRHRWRWDPIGAEHTNPLTCAQAIDMRLKSGQLTDRDVQETYYNRDYEEWQAEMEECKAFRDEMELGLGSELPQPEPVDPADQGGDNKDSK